MKKAIFALALALVLSTSVFANALQYTALLVGSNVAFVNDDQLQLDPQNADVIAFVENNRTFVPVRFITESYGGTAEWFQETQTVELNVNNINILLMIGEPQITINGIVRPLDVAPIVRNDRTFLPLRAIVEAMGKQIFYDRGLILISDIENILHPVWDADVVDWIISRF